MPLSVPHGWSLPKAVSTPGRRKAGPLKEPAGLFRVRRGSLVRRVIEVRRVSKVRRVSEARRGTREIRETQETREIRETEASKGLADSRARTAPRALPVFRDRKAPMVPRDREAHRASRAILHTRSLHLTDSRAPKRRG